MFQDLLIILFISVLSVSLMRKFAQPAILGYLFTGMLVSPNWLGFVQERSELETISEFGVVFLLFMIGLELSVPKLISMRRSLITLGGGQVLITTLIIIAIGSQIEVLSLAGSIAIAGALTLSSTAVVTKQLVEQSELQSRYGQLILSILLFQDLAAVPFLIIIPSLANSGNGTGASISSELYTLIPIGILVVGALLIVGRVILRPLYNIVAGAQSSELFMLATLLVALSSGAITGAVGLSKELGAFLAGVMLAETQYAHQIETDIQPFRDVLLGLFFVTVGIHLQPYILVMYFKTILMLLVALIAVKTSVVYCLARYIGKHDRTTSLKAGLSLAQGGEFGFAILAIETSSAILPSDILNIVTCVVILSLTIAPVLIRKGQKIADLLLRKPSKAKPLAIEDLVNTQQARREHVILCGYGRTGQSLALFLEQENISFVGIELDPDRLEEALNAQEPIYYGDATKEETLLVSGLLYAKLVVITFDDAHKARRMLKIIRFHSPSVPVLVRTRDDRYLTSLQQSGATEVIPEGLEGSLMMASHMLLLLGVASEKVNKKISDIKSYRYQMMRFFYQTPQKVPELTPMILHAVMVSAECWALGKTVEALKKEHFPAIIRSFTRKGIRSSQEPQCDVVLQEGDILMIEGTRQAITESEDRIIHGELQSTEVLSD
jgi:CPA2 family monovalent cation:H+ antiporter-2